MKYKDKTKEQLINESAELHQRIEDLEAEATERKQLETEIQDAREYAENIVETVREPLVVLNSDLKILTANRSFYDTFEVTPKETIGNLIYNLGNRQWDIPRLRTLLEDILPKNNKFDNYEVEHVFSSIGHKIMLLNARRIIQKEIGSQMILLAIEDITERRQLEILLSESEERYRRLFETADDGIFLLEKREGNITHANPAITKMLGYTKEECIGKKLKNIGFSLAVDDFKKIMQELDKNGIIYYDDVPVQTKVGQTFYADIYMVNRARLVQCNIRDVTERKKAEESLREALKEVKQLKNQLCEENLYLREKINLIHSHKDIVGNSEAIRTVLNQIEQVAGTESTVLIQGETGTGKELLAHAIHNLSTRKGRLMIKVNCGSLPPTLIESEMFGREKGAFTGALSKQLGRFELANASTIFLDEIDTLPLELQTKLLRVLESGEFERLGSPRTVKVNVRIISATNRDIARLVSEGGFREDLYYRLNVFQIVVPPLRKRREDILPLVWSFVQELSKRMGKRIESIPQKSVEALQAYPWPGNVRELRNITERAMIITTGPVLHLDLPNIAQSGAEQSGTLEEVEKRHIIETLNTTGWRVSGKNGAAEILGINPKTLESRMQKLGIQRSKKNS